MTLRRLAILSVLIASTLAGAQAFTDTNGHYFLDAIEYVSNKGLMKGYAGDIFKPDAPINRAELAKILTVVYPETKTAPATSCFSDVPKDAWYTPYVCVAKAKGIVSGTNGKFSPDRTVSLVEAAKMISVADGYVIRNIRAGEDWYIPYLAFMDEKNVIPPTAEYVGQEMTRAEVALMLFRLRLSRSNEDTVSADALSTTPCKPSGEYNPGSEIDMKKVRQEWLSWYNAERAKVGVGALTLNGDLSRTATNWSNVAKTRGYIDHKRPGTTAYYDYNAIQQWFKNLGVTFKARSGSTFGESIAWNVYSCRDTECTDEAIKGIRSAFDFFYSEKGKSYRPHYDMMVAKGYTQMGMGVAFDKNSGKYYLTAHFGAEVVTNGLPTCSPVEFVSHE